MSLGNIEKQQGFQAPTKKSPAASFEDAISAPLLTSTKGPQMTIGSKPRFQTRVNILDDNGEAMGQPMTITGRECWTLRSLIDAGQKGITAFDNIGPRLSHYVFKLRGYGFAIETVHETHGGDFPGNHARYVLHSKIQVLDHVPGTRAA